MRFFYTGAAQVWTVPAGTTAITAVAYGAGSVNGEAGGRAQLRIPVLAGDVAQINVGGLGRGPSGANGGAGGWNGGGVGSFGSSGGGAGGGGAADLRLGGTALANRILTAAGSGGAANGVLGGYGGGTTGATGNGTWGGTGGTQVGGGIGGNGFTGGNGSLGQGGNMTAVSSAFGAGGGGGGYYGGGTGSWGGAFANASAGGGGSSRCETTAPRGATSGAVNTLGAGAIASNGFLDVFWLHAPFVQSLQVGGPGLPYFADLPIPVQVTLGDVDAQETLSRIDVRWRVGAGAFTTINNAHSNVPFAGLNGAIPANTGVYVFPAATFTGGTTVEIQVQVYNSANSGATASGWSPSTFIAVQTATSGSPFPIGALGDQWPDNSVTPHTITAQDMEDRITTPINRLALWVSHWAADYTPALDKQAECGFSAWVDTSPGNPVYSAVSTVQFSTVDYISYSTFTYDANTGIYTIPMAGLYLVSFEITQAVSGAYACALNGVPTGYQNPICPAPSSYGSSSLANFPVRFAGGEQLKVVMVQGTSISLQFGAFSALRVGA